MSPITVTKISAEQSSQGTLGEKCLACGVRMSLRLWDLHPGLIESAMVRNDFETVGYVIQGRAELEFEPGGKLQLQAGDSWHVPEGLLHRYCILEHFSAIEATAPSQHREAEAADA